MSVAEDPCANRNIALQLGQSSFCECVVCGRDIRFEEVDCVVSGGELVNTMFEEVECVVCGSDIRFEEVDCVVSGGVNTVFEEVDCVVCESDNRFEEVDCVVSGGELVNTVFEEVESGCTHVVPVEVC